jgi:hypothetical protein
VLSAGKAYPLPSCYVSKITVRGRVFGCYACLLKVSYSITIIIERSQCLFIMFLLCVMRFFDIHAMGILIKNVLSIHAMVCVSSKFGSSVLGKMCCFMYDRGDSAFFGHLNELTVTVTVTVTGERTHHEEIYMHAYINAYI